MLALWWGEVPPEPDKSRAIAFTFWYFPESSGLRFVGLGLE